MKIMPPGRCNKEEGGPVTDHKESERLACLANDLLTVANGHPDGSETYEALKWASGFIRDNARIRYREETAPQGAEGGPKPIDPEDIRLGDKESERLERLVNDLIIIFDRFRIGSNIHNPLEGVGRIYPDQRSRPEVMKAQKTETIELAPQGLLRRPQKAEGGPKPIDPEDIRVGDRVMLTRSREFTVTQHKEHGGWHGGGFVVGDRHETWAWGTGTWTLLDRPESETISDSPNLGLATTDELLRELRARIDVDYLNGVEAVE
jgi:hypothetical protein